jgi:hypothetical protein
MVDMQKSSPVRAVILRSAIGALGEDDELHTSLEMHGLTAAWMPGDHALSLIIGGGQVNGVQLEPALTVLVPVEETRTLAKTFAWPHPRNPFDFSRKSATGWVAGLGEPARPRGQLWGSTIKYSPFGFGYTAILVTSKADSVPSRFEGRPYLLQIQVKGLVVPVDGSFPLFRFRVYLTPDEVDDLKVVMRSVPAWLGEDSDD